MTPPLARTACRLLRCDDALVLRVSDGRELALATSPAQRHAAAALADLPLLALHTLGPAARLVWLRRADAEPDLPPADTRSQILRERWAETLAILAR